MASLATHFPESKFVYMLRDPIKTVPSLLKMLSKTWMDLKVTETRRIDGLRSLYKGTLKPIFTRDSNLMILL